MRIGRAVLSVLLMLLFAVPAFADFHPEWLRRDADVRVLQVKIHLPKTVCSSDPKQRPARAQEIKARTAPDAETRQKVCIVPGEDDSRKDAYFDGDTLYIAKTFVILPDGAEVPAGKTVVSIPGANGTTRRAALTVTEDEDASGIRVSCEEELRKAPVRLLGGDEDAPAGWAVITEVIGGQRIRVAVDLTGFPEGTAEPVGLPYEDHLAPREDDVALYTAAFFRPAAACAVSEYGFSDDIELFGMREIRAYESIRFQSPAHYVGRTCCLIPDSEELAGQPIAFFDGGRLYVQVRRDFRVLREGEEPQSGETVFGLDLLRYTLPHTFLTDDEMIKFTDTQKGYRLTYLGLAMPCPDCDGRGTLPDGSPCAACAEMPGSVGRPRRIACGAEEGILVLPVLRVAHCTVRAIEADKPVPEGWIGDGDAVTIEGVPVRYVISAAEIPEPEAVIGILARVRLDEGWMYRCWDGARYGQNEN
ncbi:MAG: hypothetical protein IKS31_04015 [Clostridia bacterium]|nr:hypothetical protein [Clostridia bacterium]